MGNFHRFVRSEENTSNLFELDQEGPRCSIAQLDITKLKLVIGVKELIAKLDTHFKRYRATYLWSM